MKKYGIYLLYPPMTDLRKEGLGRHLINFLKASLQVSQSRFVIACPSWMHQSLNDIFTEAKINENDFEIISPRNTPAFLLIYYLVDGLKFSRLIDIKSIGHDTRFPIHDIAISLLITKSLFLAILLMLGTVILLPIIIPIMAIAYIYKKIASRFNTNKFSKVVLSTINYPKSRLIKHIKKSSFIRNGYFKMQENESKLMNKMIGKRKDISAWYCPTLFWKSINDLKSPTLICAPDVVLNEFPVGFAICASHAYEQYKQVVETIRGGQYFTTYSEAVKSNTLVDTYQINPDKIYVIPHGANCLDDLIDYQNDPNGNGKRAFCSSLLSQAIMATHPGLYSGLGTNIKDIKFIFYASQVRPNKNILTLLRAYEFLLRKNHLPHKLIMTGNPDVIPEIDQFIQEKSLYNDVLWLHGLSAQQLASAYYLAEISVNPSLSEGGFPFTFTESLSVGTPVVMARIGVTQEIITDPELDDTMLFDPYDWKNMADKIEWGIKNKELLLNKQMPLYNELAKRTWTDVVKDYVDVLDKISEQKVAS